MVDIDPLTGLPKELLAMEEIIREQQSIKVHIEKRRYGKLVTIAQAFIRMAYSAVKPIDEVIEDVEFIQFIARGGYAQL